MIDDLSKIALETTLKQVLAGIKVREDAGEYPERNVGVMTAFAIAFALGYPVRIEPWDSAHANDPHDDFRSVVYIELPTGLVSWHVATMALIQYDGHSTEEKYERCQAFIDL